MRKQRSMRDRNTIKTGDWEVRREESERASERVHCRESHTRGQKGPLKCSNHWHWLISSSEEESVVVPDSIKSGERRRRRRKKQQPQQQQQQHCHKISPFTGENVFLNRNLFFGIWMGECRRLSSRKRRTAMGRRFDSGKIFLSVLTSVIIHLPQRRLRYSVRGQVLWLGFESYKSVTCA